MNERRYWNADVGRRHSPLSLSLLADIVPCYGSWTVPGVYEDHSTRALHETTWRIILLECATGVGDGPRGKELARARAVDVAEVNKMWGGPAELLRYVNSRGALPEAQLRFVMYQMLLGLHSLHANNIVHRDVKPENTRASRLC